MFTTVSHEHITQHTRARSPLRCSFFEVMCQNKTNIKVKRTNNLNKWRKETKENKRNMQISDKEKKILKQLLATKVLNKSFFKIQTQKTCLLVAVFPPVEKVLNKKQQILQEIKQKTRKLHTPRARTHSEAAPTSLFTSSGTCVVLLNKCVRVTKHTNTCSKMTASRVRKHSQK